MQPTRRTHRAIEDAELKETGNVDGPPGGGFYRWLGGAKSPYFDKPEVGNNIKRKPEESPTYAGIHAKITKVLEDKFCLYAGKSLLLLLLHVFHYICVRSHCPKQHRRSDARRGGPAA